MKTRPGCLPCIINQVLKVLSITGVSDTEEILRPIFSYLSQADFARTTPELIGDIFRIVKARTGKTDPYREIRQSYNALFLSREACFRERILRAEDPFREAVRCAILGNIIDFHPMRNEGLEALTGDVMRWFDQMETLPFSADDRDALREQVRRARTLLYLGDNCGEICLDKLLMEQMKAVNPGLKLYFGVRGAPVVNDSIAEDAEAVGIGDIAEIISNGDDALGTVLSRVSGEFRAVYDRADVIVAKGQANFESLSEERGNRYFLLVPKCEIMAGVVGVPARTMVCTKLCE